MPVEQPRFLSVAAVAGEVSVKVDQVLGWIRSGQLRAVNVAADAGGRPRWRIRAEDLDAFLATRSTQPKEARARARRKATDDGVIRFFA